MTLCPFFGEGESDPEGGDEEDEVAGRGEEGAEGFDDGLRFLYTDFTDRTELSVKSRKASVPHKMLDLLR